MSTVRKMALEDISRYLNEVYGSINSKEVWVVSSTQLDSPETRRLNRQLGVHKVNYLGNKNNKRV